MLRPAFFFNLKEWRYLKISAWRYEGQESPCSSNFPGMERFVRFFSHVASQAILIDARCAKNRTKSEDWHSKSVKLYDFSVITVDFV